MKEQITNLIQEKIREKKNQGIKTEFWTKGVPVYKFKAASIGQCSLTTLIQVCEALEIKIYAK